MWKETFSFPTPEDFRNYTPPIEDNISKGESLKELADKIRQNWLKRLYEAVRDELDYELDPYGLWNVYWKSSIMDNLSDYVRGDQYYNISKEIEFFKRGLLPENNVSKWKIYIYVTFVVWSDDITMRVVSELHDFSKIDSWPIYIKSLWDIRRNVDEQLKFVREKSA